MNLKKVVSFGILFGMSIAAISPISSSAKSADIAINNKVYKEIQMTETSLTPSQLSVKNSVENNSILAPISFALDYTQPVDIELLAKGINDYTYNDYFSSVSWITRDGKDSLSISPKAILTTNLPSGNVGYAHIGNAWNKLLSRHKNDSKFKNQTGMMNQYLCHAQFAGGYKTPWNIEPWRPSVSYAATVIAACNP